MQRDLQSLPSSLVLLRAELSLGDPSPTGLRESGALPVAPQPPPVTLGLAYPHPSALFVTTSLLARQGPTPI